MSSPSWSRRIATVLLVSSLPTLVLAAERRHYVTGRFLVEIDGVGSAPTSSLAGGNVVGEVTEARAGSDQFPRKQISRTRVEPVTIQVAPTDLTQWVKSTLEGNAQPVSGRILELDAKDSIASERAFTGALLTEITFPAFDAQSKDAASLTLTFQPESIQTKSGGSGGAAPKAAPGAGKQAKRALASPFRLTMTDLDCSRVAKIESITIRQNLASESAGDRRAGSKSPRSLSFGDLVISIADTHVKPFQDWHEDFVVKGNNGPDREKTATLELLSANLSDVIVRLDGEGVGILAVRSLSSDAGAEKIRRSEVQMYVERWRVK